MYCIVLYCIVLINYQPDVFGAGVLDEVEEVVSVALKVLVALPEDAVVVVATTIITILHSHLRTPLRHLLYKHRVHGRNAHHDGGLAGEVVSITTQQQTPYLMVVVMVVGVVVV